MDGFPVEGTDLMVKVRFSGTAAGQSDSWESGQSGSWGADQSGAWGSGQSDGWGSWGKSPPQQVDARSSPYSRTAGSENTETQKDNLYLKGIPAGADAEWIKATLSEYAVTVVECKLLPNKSDPTQSQHALVRVGSHEQALTVMSLNGGEIPGSPDKLEVDFKKESAPPSNWGKGKSQTGPPQRTGTPLQQGPRLAGKGKYVPPPQRQPPQDSNGSWQSPEQSSGSWQSPEDQSSGDGGADETMMMTQPMMANKGSGKGRVKGGAEGLLQSAISAKVLPGMEFGHDHNCLYITNLPPDCEDYHLYRLFAPFGAILPKGVYAQKNKTDGTCKGIGFVNFIDASALAHAQLAMNGLELGNGRSLQCKPAKAGKVAQPQPTESLFNMP